MVGSDIVKKDYFKRIDYIRIIACIAILLYHLNILKGGYLAVCTFFVLTGYLAVISAVGKEKFSLKEYYFNKFKKIYLPLLVVVFSSVAVISLLSFINWLNLKPETTSVLLGYNNYWQLNANLDYFVRHISSPFMHLWYIAILLQFELVFPIVYLIFKKVKEKIGKIIPCLFFLLLGLLSYLLFFITINDGSIMQAYYGTFTRAYSLLFGVFLGFVHAYYSPLIFKNKSINRVLYCFYHLLLVLMYIFVDVNFCSFNLSMIIATVISMRLIDYSTIKSNNINLFDKIIKSLSNVSYEVYLVQYPIIFVLQSIKMNSILRTISVISLTIIISYIIKYAVTFKKSKLFVLKILVSIAVFSLSIFGVYKYIVTEDHTKEMKRLEEKLNENSKLIEQQKQEYLEKKKNEEDEWQKELNDLSLGEEELKEKVKNMSVVGIGDSIMELAVRDLYKQFPNGYFDAKTNRTEHELNGILRDLKNKDMLPDVIVLNIGTNGGWSKKIKDEMLEIVGDRKIFWLNATNPDYSTFNDYLIEFAASHDNVYIIDWITVMKENPGYLISDRVHPTVKGCKLYAETIYNALYEYYLNEYNRIKEEKIKEHESKEKEKITFIGNELLLGLYDYLSKDYNESEFVIEKDMKYDVLKNTIQSKINDKSLSYNVVIALDSKLELSKDQYNEIIELLKDYKIYIIDSNTSIDKENVTIIDIEKIMENEKNVSFDNIHLTDDGNKELKKIIDNYLKKENTNS